MNYTSFESWLAELSADNPDVKIEGNLDFFLKQFEQNLTPGEAVSELLYVSTSNEEGYDTSLNVRVKPETNLNQLADYIHNANKQWWVDLHTGEPLKRNVGEMLMLATSELSEALEAHRKNLMDDHLPSRSGFEVELADCIIRVLDMVGAYGLDMDGAITEKLAYNAQRADHKRENRLLENGKAY